MAIARVHFGRQLGKLNEDVLELGSLAKRAVVRAMQALSENNVELSREVIAEDERVNALRYGIERSCYSLLATEQPVAGDLRAIVAALTIVTDLERIGDHGKTISRIHVRLAQEPRPVPLGDLPRMAQLAVSLLDRALNAYATRNLAQAQAACEADDEIDALYKQFFNVTFSYMIEGTRAIAAGTHLLQIAHEIERVGDRATNIAERVVYTQTGELVDLNA
jgi:phosphate transport system protein